MSPCLRACLSTYLSMFTYTFTFTLSARISYHIILNYILFEVRRTGTAPMDMYDKDGKHRKLHDQRQTSWKRDDRTTSVKDLKP